MTNPQECLEDWRATLLGDVTQLRQAFRKVLTGPVLFTPFQEGERRGVRFEGRIGLAAVFDGGPTCGRSAAGYHKKVM